VLLQAAARRPGIDVVGDGPLADAVELAHGAGHVNYLGPLDRAAALERLRRASALILPSTWFEGHPLVVLEAFASATPIIASRIGSLVELIEEGVTGLLVEAHDADALADAFQWAREHPTELRAMGVNARRRYEALYRGDTHLAALREAYEAAASSTRR
jgi:glycosyltransferase involved in cell wall biosynthesis